MLFLVLNRQYRQLHIFSSTDPLVALALLTGDTSEQITRIRAQHRKGNQCICLPEWILIFKHGLSHAIPSWEHKKQPKTDNWSVKKAQINVRQEQKNSSDARQIFYSWSVFVQHITNYVRGLKHRALANKRLSTYNFPTLPSPCSYISYKRKIYWGMFW